MTFIEDLARLPFTAREANAKGFLPPIVRTIGHLVYVLGWTADEARTLPEEELLGELQHAAEHWNVADAKGALSTPTVETLGYFGTAITSAITEWPNWDRPTRTRNLRALANRAVALTTVLDKELLGIRDSDAGYQL